MLNIFLFIRRHFNLLLFLFLQVISIYFIIHYSKYHEASFRNISINLTGKVNTRYNNIRQYLYLKKTNDSLLLANEILYNKLRSDYGIPDTVSKSIIDTIKIDSLIQYKKYTYYGATVIANSVSAQNNYLVLSRGKSDQLHEGMGVVDVNNAVVGIISEVNDHYAIVMSLLHKDSHVSGKLSKGGEAGILNWDGKEPNIITLTNISKSAKISKSDTIITSGFSTTFPRGLMIGKVEAVFTDPSSNFYKVKFKSSANFYNLQYVYAIDNANQQAVKELLENIKKEP